MRDNSDPQAHKAMINLTVFNARLLGQGVVHFINCAIITLWEALESDYGAQSLLLDAFVPAACLYFDWAAPAIFKTYTDSHIGPGELLKRAMKNSIVDRWQFWKDCLTVMTANQDLSRKTQKSAQLARNRMTEAES